MAVFYFLVVTILPALVVSLPTTDLLKETLSTVDRALTFFSSDYSSINVDGLFGLRIGQGQLIEAANVCAKKKNCGEYLKLLKSLTKQLDETCEKALPYIEQSDPDYYKRFEQTISKPYILPYTSTKFDSSVLSSIRTGTNSSYVEEEGDACYARIMGTFEEPKSGLKTTRCNITNSCYNMMTSQGTSKYAITHQLLFFMVIEHVGCTEQVEKFINGHKLREIQQGFCQKIYKEADNLVVNGKVKSSHRDLFLEQSVLCGSLGFEDFFRSDWIKMTLTWPDKKDGCMKSSWTQLLEIDSQKLVNSLFTNPKAHQLAGDVGKSIENKFEEELKKLSGSKTMRKLLREKAMKDDCMAHASGLAFGTFGSYVRYLVLQL
ncbi:UPF0764 protein C16orf89 homolog [Mytilus edulis]|uniref:UPF0764 protein C16orf89 homolog n=1 Tax=Mytilus edulis TaxID=6550 RepID=UPI0039EF5670